MSNISIVGAGYVGLVTAACFAEMGHQTTVIEIDPEKINLLRNGIMPVHEQDLAEIWREQCLRGRLRITQDYEQGLEDSKFVFICVGTPSTTNGRPDMRWVRSAAKSIARAAKGYVIVVTKSTVPVGTTDMVASILVRHKQNNQSFAFVSNPEFLREGCAILDFKNPIRVVIGSSDTDAADAVSRLYEPLGRPIIKCDTGTAEIAKYASNAFLATRISFINEIALLCDKYGVNIVDVAKVVGMEPRCGDGYLAAGLGWGGSCLPKDVRGLIYMARRQGMSASLLRSVLKVNLNHPQLAVAKVKRRLGSLRGKTVGILGLAFKPNSDDLREASSLAIIALLQEEGCKIRAYDPVSMGKAARILPKVTYCADAYAVAIESHALILVTDWDEFRRLDMKRICSSMTVPIFIDGRNFFDPQEMLDTGFIYEGIGRNGSLRRKQPEVALEDMIEERSMAISGVVRKKEHER